MDTVGGAEAALAAYMNVFCNSHRITMKYALQKVVEDWNSKPGDRGLYFVFRPPWIRNKPSNAFIDFTKYNAVEDEEDIAGDAATATEKTTK